MEPAHSKTLVNRWAQRAGVTLAAALLVVVPEWTVITLREWDNGFASGVEYAWRAIALGSLLPAAWLLAELVLAAVPARMRQGVRPKLRELWATPLGHVLAFALWLGAVFAIAWAISVSQWKDLDLPALIPAIDWEAQARALMETTPRMAALGLVLGGLVGGWSAWRRRTPSALPWVIKHVGPILLVMGLALSISNLARPLGYFPGLHPVVLLLAFGCYLGGLTAIVPANESKDAIHWGRIALPLLPTMAAVGLFLLLSGLGSPSGTTLRTLDANRPLATKLAVAAFANATPQPGLSCPAPAQASEEFRRTVGLSAAGGGSEPPDILFVTVDALASSRLGVLGNPNDATPTIDTLAHQGALFLEARSTGSATAVGVPGLLFSRPYECMTEPGLADLPSLFTVLKETGYRTAAFYGYPMGEGVTSSYGEPLLKPFDRSEFRGDDPMFPNTSSPDDQVAAGAIDELISAPTDKPLAMWVHFYNPHPVYNPPPSTRGRFGSGQSARYDEEILATDQAFGRLWRQWESQRADRDLIVVLTADHGQSVDELGQHGHATTLVQSMVAVPLIIAAPNLKPTQVSRIVSIIDVAPTILDLIGIQQPGSFLGQSLVPDLEGEQPDRPVRMTRSVNPNHLLQEAVVMGRYKLYREPRPKFSLLYKEPEFFALYDVVADPLERQNLADMYPDVVERMKPLLLSRVYATSEGDA